jgi:hypothetical protein
LHFDYNQQGEGKTAATLRDGHPNGPHLRLMHSGCINDATSRAIECHKDWPLSNGTRAFLHELHNDKKATHHDHWGFQEADELLSQRLLDAGYEATAQSSDFEVEDREDGAKDAPNEAEQHCG